MSVNFIITFMRWNVKSYFVGIYGRLSYRLLLWYYMEGGFRWSVIEELVKFRVFMDLKIDKIKKPTS